MVKRTKFNGKKKNGFKKDQSYEIQEWIPIPPTLFVLNKSRTSNGYKPAAFETPDTLYNAIKSYINSCWTIEERTTTDKKGKKVVTKFPRQTEPYTMTSLCLWIGCSRSTLLNYAKGKNENSKLNNPEYARLIEDAKALCESYSEKQLYVGKSHVAGIIFSMVNNYGWKNAYRQELTDPEGKPFGAGLVSNDERAKAMRERMIRDFGGEDTKM